jgi:hypothetical protein
MQPHPLTPEQHGKLVARIVADFLAKSELEHAVELIEQILPDDPEDLMARYFWCEFGELNPAGVKTIQDALETGAA